MAERPDYIPSFWWESRLNRPFERDPRLVIAWFVLLPLLGLLGGALFLGVGWWPGYVLLGAALVILVQGAVYVPRAFRAARAMRNQR